MRVAALISVGDAPFVVDVGQRFVLLWEGVEYVLRRQLVRVVLEPVPGQLDYVVRLHGHLCVLDQFHNAVSFFQLLLVSWECLLGHLQLRQGLGYLRLPFPLLTYGFHLGYFSLGPEAFFLRFATLLFG